MPLRFTLFPIVLAEEQPFSDELAACPQLCQVIVAEGIPSPFVPAQEWMAHPPCAPFVDPLAALRQVSLRRARVLGGIA